MTVGWGVDATVDGSGVVTSGTQSSDVRKVWGALYTPGIIDGCEVTRSGSDMTYTVASGVCALKVADKEIIMAPIQGQTVGTDPAPLSGTRVDLLYAEQMFPSSGSSNLILRVASFATLEAVVVPPNSVAIQRYLISAGQTNTNAATQAGPVDFSIPYGATLGRLHYYQYTASDLFSPGYQKFGVGTISLPTDRRVRFTMHADLGSEGAVGFDNSKYCEYGFLPSYDNLDFILWSTPGLHQSWQTVSYSVDKVLPAGTHPVHLASIKITGLGTGRLHYGWDNMGYHRRGLEFYIDDIGPAV